MKVEQPIIVRPIEHEDVDAARDVILSVAKNIFGWEQSIEEISCMLTKDGELGDLQDIQGYYLDRDGIFLVAVDRGAVIGTGGIHGISNELCELKRLWLLENYHGRGIGYQLVKQLMDHAVHQGFQKIRLVTSPLQIRAIQFYRNIGFKQVGSTGTDESEYVFEMTL